MPRLSDGPVGYWPGRWWFVGIGVIMLVLGVVGLLMTIALTIVSALWYGVLMMTAGAIQMLEAIAKPGESEAWSSRIIRVLSGVLYVAGGLYVSLNPLEASLALTLLLGVVLIASGIARAVWALVHETRHSRATIVLLAVLSIAFGIAIINQWPLSGLWAIGLFVSCDLIASGLSWCWSGLASDTKWTAPVASPADIHPNIH